MTSPTHTSSRDTHDAPLDVAGAEHLTHDHVAAVFPDRHHAESAVEHLRSIGFDSEHLGLAVRSDDAVVFEHDLDAERAHSGAITAGLGAPVGFIAGMGLATLAAPTLALGGFLALAGIGAGWGAMLGGFLGLSMSDRSASQHAAIEWTHLEPGEVLVAVCTLDRARQVIETMREHGGEVRYVPRLGG